MELSEFYYPLPEKYPDKETNYDCDKCGILGKRTLSHAKFPPTIGKNYDGFVLVPTNPTHEEDSKGTLLTSSMGTQLRSAAYKLSFNLVEKAAIVPLIRCAVGKPTDVQARCCFKELDRILKELNPKVIVPIGDLPFKQIMHSKNKVPNGLIRNRIIPNYFYNAIVFPIWDINDIKGKSQKHITDACIWDIQRIIGLYKKRFKYRKKIDEFLKARKILSDISIIQVKTIKEAETIFDMFGKLKEFSFDYETTNVFPYDDNFEIVYFQFGLEKTAWVFHESLWSTESNRKFIFNGLITLLINPNIKKIIQNSKFEDLASRFVLGIKWIENMECTMLASHVIDERAGGTSLDFQNLMRFGIPPYNQITNEFLKPKEGAKVNRIRECPIDDMIKYGGLDAITTFNNWKLIESSLFGSYPKARENYEILKKGHWTYGNMQQRGITLGESEYNILNSMLDKKAKEILDKIHSLPEFIEFNEYLKTKLPKGSANKNTILKKLEDKIHGEGGDRSIQSQSDLRNDGIGISESLRNRISAIRRTVHI